MPPSQRTAWFFERHRYPVSRVSVIIPTYNRQELIQETIESVIRQTFSDWELIVVDDGSTDDTRRVLEERYGSRIRYAYQSNQGESAARNHGLSLATAEYVAFLDSDDLWHPNKLQRQLEVIEKSPQAGLISTQAYWMNFEGLRLRQLPHGHDLGHETISWEDLVLDNVVAGGGSSALARRTCLDQVGGFDPQIRFGEEWDLWIRIARHYRIRQLPEPLVFYRVHRFGTRGWAPRAHEAENIYCEHRSILEKAFADCPLEPTECEELRATALGRIDLRNAIVDCALEKPARGSEHWLAAIRLCPQFAADHTMVNQYIAQFVVGYASVAKPGHQITEISRRLGLILDNAPSEISFSKARRHALRSRCLAELAFAAAYDGKQDIARRAAYHCLTTDAVWRQNRGLWKILVTGGRHLWPEPISL